MRRRGAILTGSLFLAAPAIVLAQAAGKTVRIGVLFGDAPLKHEEQALLEGLREQGLVEGRNLVIERRYAEGRLQLVPGYASELATLQLDAIISTCTPTTRIAQQALGTTLTSTPIIMAAVADPVGQKLIASLAKPGANVTGLSSQAEDIMPKMLELFASVLPQPAKVAVLMDLSSGVHPRMWRALGKVAQKLDIRLVKVEAGRKPGDPALPAAFDAAARQQADGVFVLPDEPFFMMSRAQIVALAARHRLPAFYGVREFVDEGGLMSYGESLRTAYRGLAPYIAKVAAGASPADMPVSQPTQFELVINLRTAKTLGLKLPQSLLVSANDVIQ